MNGVEQSSNMECYTRNYALIICRWADEVSDGKLFSTKQFNVSDAVCPELYNPDEEPETFQEDAQDIDNIELDPAHNHNVSMMKKREHEGKLS